MSVYEAFYDVSPVHALDQNKWDLKLAEVALQFRESSVYTPLINWVDHTEAQNVWESELLDGDVDAEEISMTANYVTAGMPFDSRMRKFTVGRYGDKVQMHKSDNYFNQWKLSGGSDFRPLLRGVLGKNVLRKHEILARNIFMRGPKTYWTYGGNATSFATLSGDDTFGIAPINAWNLRLGNTGMPIVPGASASAKIVMIPPGAKYDFFNALPTATGSEASMWRDIAVYGDQTPILRGEVGQFKGVRFVEVANDRYGYNSNVLYNCGAITKQLAVTQPIRQGDGSPDPESTMVDDTWYVGQKNVTHYIQLEDFAAGDFSIGDIVTIHIKTSAAYGVTGGVDTLDTQKIERKVALIDATNNRLSFDRPIMKDFTAGFVGKSVTGNTDGTFYAYVTKAKHVGFGLVLGSRDGVQGRTYKAIEFYEPKAIDDFDSVYRATWDEIIGYNVQDPNMFECHFFNVSLPKPGGIVTP